MYSVIANRTHKLANISEAPLPNIGDKAELWDELCASRIDIEPHFSAETQATARHWLARLPRPVVLFHQKGNTAQERKSLPDEVTIKFYEEFINQCDGTLVLLDWDQRVPRLASHRVRHLSDLRSHLGRHHATHAERAALSAPDNQWRAGRRQPPDSSRLQICPRADADFMAQVLFCDRLAVERVLGGNCDCGLQLDGFSGM